MSADGVVGEVVVAMAGHVDHGKSALAHALTGQRTDRRDTEQARGLTVDLGHLVLPGEHPTALTDVPGHVDYLANTMAGLAGATHALLVVAADDGWMPQTEDHVRAARHLGVPLGAVAVTKADLVDAARVDAVVDDVRRRLAASGPAVEPQVISVRDGTGVPALADRLAGLEVPVVPDTPSPRLWIDRAFHVGGRGLVVAGSLAAGALAAGDHVSVGPAGSVGRVRSLQQHGASVPSSRAPGRVAVDLADATAERGDRLLDGRLGRRAPTTTAVDAWMVSDHDPGIGERGAWVLHVGSTHVEVEVDPFDRAPVTPGHDAPVHLRLARALPLVQGDRFVVRDVGRRVVAGGGVVLDPAPRGRARGGAARRARADALVAVHTADHPLGALVEADGGAVRVERVVTAAGAPDGVMEVVAGHVVSPGWRHRLADAATAAVEEAGPDGLAVDVAVGRLAATLEAPADVVRAALPDVDGVEQHDTRLVAAGRRADLDDIRTKALGQLHDALRRAPLAPEPLDDLVAGAGVAPADLDRLVRSGELLRSGRYGFLPAAVNLVVGRLRALQEREGDFSVAQARDALGITRRHAVPWMELLDRLQVTVRVGDLRRLDRPGGSTRRGRPRTDR